MNSAIYIIIFPIALIWIDFAIEIASQRIRYEYRRRF